MKHKKLLLVIFFLTLFVFQQTQAIAKILPKGNLPQTNLVKQNGLLPELWVRMYHLNPDGSVVGDRKQCATAAGDNTYGCVQTPATQYYPYDFNPIQLAYDADPNNHQQIDMEADYLLDVLSKEMDVPNYPNLVPLQAQAVAARSFADYNFRAQNGMINNSTEDHVFVPYAFDSYLQNVEQQNTVRNAVTSTSKYYLSYGGSPINAEFGSDMGSSTTTYSGTPSLPYLTGVQDPISAACGSTNNSYDDAGMSQKGANRWALGDQCANQLDRDQYNGGAKLSWIVTWTDYRQILAHYYTGIDILGPNGKVAPDDRWNLLNYTIPPGGTTVNAGGTFNVNVTLQNTSTTDWTTDRFCLSFYARRRISPPRAG